MEQGLRLADEEIAELISDDCKEKLELVFELNRHAFDTVYQVLRLISVFLLVFFKGEADSQLAGIVFLGFAMAILAVLSILISGTIYVVLNRRFQKVYHELRCPLSTHFEHPAISLLNATLHGLMAVALLLGCTFTFISFLDGSLNPSDEVPSE
ncbi:hypothetical protein GMRT_11715 [Giardia muris]|uniref:Uncharacterized protein n=1 Tax=Giardia muris TaxID=5742 RepID=A0A4Z1SM24_GIAMU|nr:hypothetical protein GMRT_11715 [Giardia muris]|eukprot:TNJ26724.1 hypothetical protein GMRT_11715 [Giardia muris]